MRLNRYIALSSGMSRRAADKIIEAGQVHVNGQLPTAGQQVQVNDVVVLDGQELQLPQEHTTILLNKPEGYICSRDGQGSKTIYDLISEELHTLKPVGRLDKNSSGLLLMTDDGELAQQLTHPKYQKVKVYEITLNRPLEPLHRQMIADKGIMLDDGVSQLGVERINDGDDRSWRITMHEGRNRQIRRTFVALGYDTKRLHRTHFGTYELGHTRTGEYQRVT